MPYYRCYAPHRNSVWERRNERENVQQFGWYYCRVHSKITIRIYSSRKAGNPGLEVLKLPVRLHAMAMKASFRSSNTTLFIPRHLLRRH